MSQDGPIVQLVILGQGPAQFRVLEQACKNRLAFKCCIQLVTQLKRILSNEYYPRRKIRAENQCGSIETRMSSLR